MHEKNKRLRVMAGPNGSGKSTIISAIRLQYNCGPFVNADDIERQLVNEHSINLFELYNISPVDEDFVHFLNAEGKSWIDKAQSDKRHINLEYENTILKVPTQPNGYDAAIAADFIRQQLLKNKETFTFETVLSHPSKIQFLKKANKAGFKNYLYFICTVDPAINIERVAQRVLEGGHDVPKDKIKKRYRESLEILPELIKVTNRSFLFDNSTKDRDESILPVAEIINGEELIIHKPDVPWWIQKHVIEPLFPDE